MDEETDIGFCSFAGVLDKRRFGRTVREGERTGSAEWNWEEYCSRSLWSKGDRKAGAGE